MPTTEPKPQNRKCHPIGIGKLTERSSIWLLPIRLLIASLAYYPAGPHSVSTGNGRMRGALFGIGQTKLGNHLKFISILERRSALTGSTKHELHLFVLVSLTWARNLISRFAPLNLHSVRRRRARRWPTFARRRIIRRTPVRPLAVVFKIDHSARAHSGQAARAVAP